MINKHMNKTTPNVPKKPNEESGLSFSTSVKIFDPVSKEVLLSKRGDN